MLVLHWSWQSVTSGVSQRSVLLPLFFVTYVTYINDVDDDIMCSTKKFVGDTELYSDVFSAMIQV